MKQSVLSFLHRRHPRVRYMRGHVLSPLQTALLQQSTAHRVNTQQEAQLMDASYMQPPSHESQVLPAEQSARFGVGCETGGDGVVGHTCSKVE